jgi:hypothetical protein
LYFNSRSIHSLSNLNFGITHNVCAYAVAGIGALKNGA